MVTKMTIVVGALTALSVNVLMAGWALMLLLGMFAGYLAIPTLAIGYWASVVSAMMIRFVIHAVEIHRD